MSHDVLMKHGWKMVFVGGSFVAYQQDDILLVKFDSGKEIVYKRITNG